MGKKKKAKKEAEKAKKQKPEKQPKKAKAPVKEKKKKAKKEKTLKKLLNLRKAKKSDVVELIGYKADGGKKWGLRNGMPYWLINSKGEIENKNYILTEHTDPEEFGDYMKRKQVLIPA